MEVVNLCFPKPNGKGYERVSLGQLLNLINSFVTAAACHGFLIFDEGREDMVAHLYRRLRSRNLGPSRYEAWGDAERTKDISIKRVIGVSTFRCSHCLLQMTELVAHALLL